MELILSALFGAGVTFVVLWLQALRLWRELDFLRDSADFWHKSALQLECVSKDAADGWGRSIDDSIAWAALVKDIKGDHQALRDRLAAALWELRRAKRAMAKMSTAPLSREDIAWGVKWAHEHGYGRLDDDQVTWRLGELERKMATWEGD